MVWRKSPNKPGTDENSPRGEAEGHRARLRMQERGGVQGSNFHSFCFVLFCFVFAAECCFHIFYPEIKYRSKRRE